MIDFSPNSLAQLGLNLPSPIQQLHSPLLDAKSIRLFVKRDDLNHPIISGNKWRKLKYNLIEAGKQQRPVLTFGGAYSNHIHAVAGAGRIFDFPTIGVIRGEETLPLNPTLQFAVDNGMQLHYLSRKTYREKMSRPVIDQLEDKFGKTYLIPEGGSNQLAMPGVAELVKEIDSQVNFDYLITACGTGGTLAGLVSSGTEKRLLGVAVLKGAEFLNQEVTKLGQPQEKQSWEIFQSYHFGGYAKIKTSLLDFITEFEAAFKIPIEPIYTGKMFFGLFDLIKNDYFAKDSTIVALHSGGLQSRNGKEIE